MTIQNEESLKNLPIFSADQKPIKVNTVLYRVKYDTGYGYKGTTSCSIEALRVFNVNNQHRIFRVRCVKGCEEVFKVADGCNRTQFFVDLKNAREQVWKFSDENIKKCKDKLKRVNKTIDSIIKARRSALVKKPKLPKAVS